MPSTIGLAAGTPRCVSGPTSASGPPATALAAPIPEKSEAISRAIDTAESGPVTRYPRGLKTPALTPLRERACRARSHARRDTQAPPAIRSLRSSRGRRVSCAAVEPELFVSASPLPTQRRFRLRRPSRPVPHPTSRCGRRVRPLRRASRIRRSRRRHFATAHQEAVCASILSVTTIRLAAIAHAVEHHRVFDAQRSGRDSRRRWVIPIAPVCGFWIELDATLRMSAATAPAFARLSTLRRHDIAPSHRSSRRAHRTARSFLSPRLAVGRILEAADDENRRRDSASGVPTLRPRPSMCSRSAADLPVLPTPRREPNAAPSPSRRARSEGRRVFISARIQSIAASRLVDPLSLWPNVSVRRASRSYATLSASAAAIKRVAFAR